MEDHEKFSKTKSIIVGAIVLTVIIASFWLSFSLGKKVFVPVRPDERAAEETVRGQSAAESFPAEVATGIGQKETPPKIEMPEIEVKVTPLAQPETEVAEKAAGEPAVKEEKVTVWPAARPLPKRKPAPQIMVKKPVATQAKKVSATSAKKWQYYYKVLAGSFTNLANAQRIANQLKEKGFPVYLDKVLVASQRFYRIQTGAFTQRKQAEALLSQLKEAGFEASIVIE